MHRHKGRHTQRGRAHANETTHLAYIDRNRRTARVGMFHVALQVDVQKLEHEIELLIRMHDVQQPGPYVSTLAARASFGSALPDDVVVFELL
jgi:hypothetical protein